MKRALYFATSVSLLFFASITGCKKEEKNNIDDSPKYDIYTATSSSVNNENTNTIIYCNGEMRSSLDGGVLDMAIEKNSIYCLMYDRVFYEYHGVPNYNDHFYYSIDNKDVTIKKGGYSFLGLRSIAVLNNDVYVVGIVSSDTSVLWKNGEVELILPGTQLYSVKSVGNDWYMCGSIGSTGAYWKNGVSYTIEALSTITEIAVDNGNMYLAGYTQQNSQTVPAYWINGEKNYLPEGRWITGMAIQHGTTFITGNTTGNFDAGLLWENGIVNHLAIHKTTGISTATDALCIYGDSQYLLNDSLYTMPLPNSHIIKRMEIVQR